MVQALLENERKQKINISIGIFNTIHEHKIEFGEEKLLGNCTDQIAKRWIFKLNSI